MTQRDGGPAFPNLHEAISGQSTFNLIGHPGISKRDYFAAAALTGQLASLTNAEVVAKIHELGHALGADTPFELAAISAYRFADAMIAESQREPTP